MADAHQDKLQRLELVDEGKVVSVPTLGRHQVW
jgi:hypothetical protein